MNDALSPADSPESIYVRNVETIPDWANVVLPRFGETTSEDLFADAASKARQRALGRCSSHYPGFNFHVMSNTTDDLRFAAAESVSAEPMDVAGFATDLVRIFGCPVHVNPLTADIDPQWSEFDQVVLQLGESSTWRITEPRDLSALPGFSDPEPSTAEVWSGTIAPGTAMIIPRGWGFGADGLAESGQSCIAFTLARWTGLDLITELARPAGNWPLLRASAPVDIAAATESYDGDLYRENKFGELLGEIATLEQVDSCLARLQAQVRLGAETLTAPVDRDAAFELNAPTGVFWVATDDPDEILVAFSGLMLEVAPEALPAFASLANGEPTRVVDLPLTVSADGSATLVNELAQLGLISRR